VSLLALLLLWWLIGIAWLLAIIDTRCSGFYRQQRVGLHGRLFWVVKIRTMRPDEKCTTTVTRRGDSRITCFGSLLRRLKIDELPQLWNVLIGDMSLVGPRPDVPGFADSLGGAERAILEVRPGITGPATIKYRDEEALLDSVEEPECYNRNVIFPDKVQINLRYIENWSFVEDLKYIWKTLF
jgi:lipopolysaccharide/colanic/teichoic acid biosynthesis glycosyltransferase